MDGFCIQISSNSLHLILKKNIAINKIDWISYKIFHERGKYCKQSQKYIIYTFVFRDLHIFTFIFILFCVIAVKISNC